MLCRAPAWRSTIASSRAATTSIRATCRARSSGSTPLSAADHAARAEAGREASLYPTQRIQPHELPLAVAPSAVAVLVALAVPVAAPAHGLSGARIEEQLSALAFAAETEHVVKRSRLGVERRVADPAGVPVVLDEARDRGLVGRRAVDEVRLRERR